MKLLFLFSAGTLVALVDAAAYLQTTLTKGATMHQFHLAKGWEKDASVINARISVKNVMQKMNTKGSGMFTAIILEGADTCVSRSTAGNGLQSPLDYAKSQPKASTFLLTNGGFFVNDKGPKNDFSVGPTSGKDAQYVSVPDVYRNVFGRLGGDDGSFLECGPVLKRPIDQSEDRFQYFQKGTKVETDFAKLPGGTATANENNERLAMVKMGPRHRIVFAYTSLRDHGVKINDLRALMDAFLQGFLGKGIEKADLALNLDGGRSIFVGWQTNGERKGHDDPASTNLYQV
ncbi:hypothetical protein MAPG_07286 [Magnaporthiopsis poae ATCC 64411]|uniref:Phosphodiester glycosidase domain-containing protein n=1 Tax=Magnaporthiopsis poae (strain ATCC 64411 / 73-15) TaxID=644358 RepID=A0A0C4E495_MAGP6|nr:hypothetical protein MAPG_07286 [Magnaporthiopsis poae ATCC 64411]